VQLWETQTGDRSKKNVVIGHQEFKIKKRTLSKKKGQGEPRSKRQLRQRSDHRGGRKENDDLKITLSEAGKGKKRDKREGSGKIGKRGSSG